MSGFAEYQPGVSRRSVDVVVRPAEIADLQVCADLIVSRTGGSAADRRERLVADLADPDRYIAVAVVDGEVVGYGGVIPHELSPDDPPTTAPSGYYLIGLIVSPDWRRHGIGELLTRDRIRWTAERADAVYYFANQANSVILELNKQFGFTEVTRDFVFPGAPLKPGTCVLLRAGLNDR
ncbi:GNAT family N-acetyltransferase [Kribbella sp. NBC_00709]|uniref:GNAT family N-acetyltransferase n=1 Tax=Kribbella sp. NBC_00709 TaxID=2975972 RepID=UPI002E2DAF6D|nr:GNAT family N-acetyltransferase [Kribbella sp. NBC_00709]